MMLTANLPEPLADSVDMAAFRLGICRAQLYREVAAGRLKVRKMGRRTLVPRIEQERWLAALPVHDPLTTNGAPRLGQMSGADFRASIEQGGAPA